MDTGEHIQAFLAGSTFAVAGASTNRAKYGNKVLRCYQQHGLEAWPINPRADEIEGATCYPDVASLPGVPHGLSIITPPAHSDGVVDAAMQLGVQHIWFQPGAEHDDAIERARAAGLNVIAHGPCLLVALGFRE